MEEQSAIENINEFDNHIILQIIEATHIVKENYVHFTIQGQDKLGLINIKRRFNDFFTLR